MYLYASALYTLKLFRDHLNDGSKFSGIQPSDVQIYERKEKNEGRKGERKEERKEERKKRRKRGTRGKEGGWKRETKKERKKGRKEERKEKTLGVILCIAKIIGDKNFVYLIE
jgi:hypothetical protein